MKKFEIKNSNVFFLSKDNELTPIDNINKEELLYLVNELVESDEFDMDEYDDNLIKNEAHKIIYKNVYGKFKELQDNKKAFKEKYENLYQEALEKYTNG